MQRNVSYFTNQQQNLVYFLAQAGVTDAMLRQATVENPIVLHGNDIDVTTHQGLSMHHFCRSVWELPGVERREIKAHQRLSHHPLIRLMEEVERRERRYDVITSLYFDHERRAAILLICEFQNPRDIPKEINIQLEGERLIEAAAVPFIAAPSSLAQPELLECLT